MREIKFRGKRVDNDEWISGDLVYGDKGKAYISPVPVLSGSYIVVPNGKIGYQHGELKMHEVRPETVGQYTGLKDKNGKEIYEGDILKTYSELLKHELIGSIKYADKWGSFYLTYKNPHGIGVANTDVHSWYYSNMPETDEEILAEIIGNIHDKETP